MLLQHFFQKLSMQAAFHLFVFSAKRSSFICGSMGIQFALYMKNVTIKPENQRIDL